MPIPLSNPELGEGMTGTLTFEVDFVNEEHKLITRHTQTTTPVIPRKGDRVEFVVEGVMYMYTVSYVQFRYAVSGFPGIPRNRR